MQALQSCSCDLERAIPEYERRRLPDIHALYKLDLTADARVGSKGTPVWNLDYLGAKVHILLNVGLMKLLPQVFKGPAMMTMWSTKMPFRQVSLGFRV